MHPIVRVATEADMPALMEQYTQSHVRWLAGRIQSNIRADPTGVFLCFSTDSTLLAEIGGHAVGIATYYATFSTLQARPGIWLDDLYVREEYRSRGVGRMIMSTLARIAKETNCRRIDWTVALSNHQAIAFYERKRNRSSSQPMRPAGRRGCRPLG